MLLTIRLLLRRILYVFLGVGGTIEYFNYHNKKRESAQRETLMEAFDQSTGRTVYNLYDLNVAAYKKKFGNEDWNWSFKLVVDQLVNTHYDLLTYIEDTAEIFTPLACAWLLYTLYGFIIVGISYSAFKITQFLTKRKWNVVTLAELKEEKLTRQLVEVGILLEKQHNLIVNLAILIKDKNPPSKKSEQSSTSKKTYE